MRFLKLPTGIDFHVHFREPGLNWKENFKTGKKAAHLGGIDTVIEMPNTIPPVDNLEVWRHKNELTERLFSDEENRGNDVKVINAVVLTNRNTHKRVRTELLETVEQVKILKVFMANSTGDLAVDYRSMISAFEDFAQLSNPPLVIFHAEDPALIKPTSSWRRHEENRPVQAEVDAIQRILEIKDRYNIFTHITHVSSGTAASLLVKEQRLTWDTTPKHLSFDTNDMEKFQNFGVINPPLRTPEEREILFELFESQKIPIIASDHSPHTKKDKEKPVSGAPGVQELYPYLIDQHLNSTISQRYLENVIYYNPASVLKQCGFFIERKTLYVNINGSTEVDKNWIQSKVGWSLWDGKVFKGRIMRN